MANANIAIALGLLATLMIVNNPVRGNPWDLPVAGLFPFGDGFYDLGNKQYFLTEKGPPTYWPYGKSIDAPNGRWSDGRVLPDFVAGFFDIPNTLQAALDPTANVSRGVSFAVADATVLGEPDETMTLSQQVSLFGQSKSNWTDDFLAQSVFMFYIGGNDYINFTKFNPTASPSTQRAFATSVISKICNELRNLHALGARKFAFQTLGPLGCYPIVKQDYKLRNECLASLNDVVKQHNEKIRPMLTILAQELHGFQYTIFDFYDAVMRRFADPWSYRCVNAEDACCGIGSHTAYGCGFLNVHSKLCDYQRAYLFFDGLHHTEKQQEEFAHLFFGADPSVVKPMTLRELLVYPVNEPMREV